jgi:hypothetical protein
MMRNIESLLRIRKRMTENAVQLFLIKQQMTKSVENRNEKLKYMETDGNRSK